jgi:hypothetical protein
MTLNTLPHGLEQTICRKLIPFKALVKQWLISCGSSVSYTGTDSAEWDKNTWGPLEDLARNHPDAGIHFQKCQILNRAKDSQSTTAAWFAELLSPSPWFKDVVPNVSVPI